MKIKIHRMILIRCEKITIVILWKFVILIIRVRHIQYLNGFTSSHMKNKFGNFTRMLIP